MMQTTTLLSYRFRILIIINCFLTNTNHYHFLHQNSHSFLYEHLGSLIIFHFKSLQIDHLHLGFNDSYLHLCHLNLVFHSFCF